MGAFLDVVNFSKISGLCQTQKLPWNLLEKLGEVFKNNFLTAMQDIKRRIKAGTAKNRCHTISERSFFFFLARKLKIHLMELSNKQITKALIRLRVCAGWSAPLQFANPRRQISSQWQVHYSYT